MKSSPKADTRKTRGAITKRSYKLSALLAEMPKGKLPRVRGWDEMAPVGLESFGWSAMSPVSVTFE